MKISKCVFRAIEGLLFPYSGFSKGHNSVKTVCIVMVLVICILSDLALYLYKVSSKYQKGFQRY